MSDPLSPETLAEIEAIPREVADAMVLGTRANISYADAEELWSAMMDAWGRTLLAEVRRQAAEIERLRAALGAMNAVCDHQTNRQDSKAEELGLWGIPQHFHPLTCGNDSKHTPLFPYWTGERIILMCRDCSYTQNNAGMFWRPWTAWAAPPISPEARE